MLWIWSRGLVRFKTVSNKGLFLELSGDNDSYEFPHSKTGKELLDLECHHAL